MAAAAWLAAASPPASALQPGQPDRDRWLSSTELSFVRTGGNAVSSTFGLATTVTRSWERTEVKIETGGVRTRSTHLRRVAVGSETSFRVEETSETETSAEHYRAQLRVDRRFSARTAVFAQSAWTRNTFSGVRHRLVNVLGVSTRWADGDDQRLRTAYGLTHTVQRDVVPDPEAADRFVGLQVSSEYWRRVTGNTEWTSNLVVDGNGDDTSDLRADWTNSLSVAMSERFGLKTSLRATFDNQPALARLPLRSPDGRDAGSVLARRRKLDRVFTVALVVSL